MKIQDQKISLFTTVFPDAKQAIISINSYFEGIIKGEWQDEVLQYRAGKLDKKKIKSVTASGLFAGRSDKDLQEHSGLLVIDIDSKDQTEPIENIRQSLLEIPELFAVHYSLGGSGLAVYFRINKAKHYESFEAITKMLANDYGAVSDMHCSNIGRLRFVSYDPECYLNYGAVTWKYLEKKNKSQPNENQYENFVFSGNDVDFILKQIRDGSVNIAPDYYSWLRIGFAFAEKFGEAGRQYFNLISSYYIGKQKITPDKQYDRCLRAGKRGISIKSFFYYAKLAGCNLVSNRTSKIKTTAKIKRKQESSRDSGSIANGKQEARKYLEEFEGITGKDVDEVLDQVWNLPASELAAENDTVLNDVEVFLKSNYQLRYNEITNLVEVNEKDINDYIENSICMQAKRVISMKVGKDLIGDLLRSDFTPKYNPLHEWFEKNKSIKTEGNIKKLASCIDSNLSYYDSEFIEYFLEKWLISIIASCYGTYSIICFVLTGQEHGTGKTNFFRQLLPDRLQWAFTQNKLDGKEADVAKLMCSKLLILDDEFGGKSKADEKKFKELISTQKFSVRMPYGRNFEDLNRLAVLCGTSNEEHILNDLTGNRRIIPIQVNSIDEKKYREIDKTELFIELYWKYRKNPEDWFLDKGDIFRLNEVTGGAQQTAPELELPLKYFDKVQVEDVKDIDPGIKFVSTSEIRSTIEQRSGIRLSQQKLSITLKKLGFEKTQKMISGIRARGFYVREKGIYQNEIRNNTESETNNNDDAIKQELPF